jgi:phenylacetic acid degradation operon negative regulatory protein
LGHPASLILFVLGAARVPPEPPLPGPALVALLSDLGLSEGAARSAILRMRRGGWLDSHRGGRTVAYSPSERVVTGHRRRAGTLSSPDETWSGSFHALLVSVAESSRPFRDEFRRAAHIAGYRTLRSGLVIAPSDRRRELGDILDRVPADASVIPGWLALDPGDARRVAGELWALDDLAAWYRQLTGRAEAASARARGAVAGAATFRAFAAATLPIYQAVADDPGLPAALCPPDWPAPALGRALAGALQAFGPAVAAYLTEQRQRAT